MRKGYLVSWASVRIICRPSGSPTWGGGLEGVQPAMRRIEKMMSRTTRHDSGRRPPALTLSPEYEGEGIIRRSFGGFQIDSERGGFAIAKDEEFAFAAFGEKGGPGDQVADGLVFQFQNQIARFQAGFFGGRGGADFI